MFNDSTHRRILIKFTWHSFFSIICSRPKSNDNSLIGRNLLYHENLGWSNADQDEFENNLCSAGTGSLLPQMMGYHLPHQGRGGRLAGEPLKLDCRLVNEHADAIDGFSPCLPGLP